MREKFAGKFFVLLLCFVLFAQVVAALNIYSGSTTPRYCPVIVQHSTPVDFKVYSTSGRYTGVSGTIASTSYGAFQMTSSYTVGNYIVRAHGESKTFQLSSSASCNYCFINNRPFDDGEVNPYDSNQYCDASKPWAWQTRHVHHIIITPSTSQILVYGNLTTFTATGYDADGAVVKYPLEWELEGDDIGSIVNSYGDSRGATAIFKAEKAGIGYIVASSDGVEKRVQIAVLYGALSEIELQLTPDVEEVKSGESVRIVAIGFDEDGNKVPINPSWSRTGTLDSGVLASSGSVATFTGKKVGTANITARQGSVQESVSLKVIPGNLSKVDVLVNGETAPETIELQAGESKKVEVKAFDANDNNISASDLEVEWSSNMGEFDDEDRAKTVFTAREEVGLGSLRVIVEDEYGNSKTKTFNVRVVHGLLESIEVTPEEASMKAGEQKTFIATGFDEYGNAFSVNADWRAEPTGLGKFVNGSSGRRVVFEAVRAVDGEIIASSSGISGFASVSISPGPVSSVEIYFVDGSLPVEPLEVEAGEAIEFVAKAKDAFGNSISEDISFEWSLIPESVGELEAEDERAEFKASEELSENVFGAIGVVARTGGKSASDTVAIQLVPGPLASIIVLPESAEIRSGDIQLFTAVGVDEYGNEVEVNPTWSVSSELGEYEEVVGSSYEFVATKAGEGTITASVGEISRSAGVVVVPGDLASITVTSNGETVPSEFSMKAREEKNFEVKAFDANGNEIVEGLGYEWNSNVGEFDVENEAEAIFTAQEEAPASGEISVLVVDEEENRRSASFAVEIQPSVLTRIEIQPSEPEPIKSGYTQTFTATGFDEYDNEVEGIDPNWNVEPEEIGVLSKVEEGKIVLTGVKVGEGTINAWVGSVSDSASVVVVPGDLASITVTSNGVEVPSEFSMKAGEEKNFEVKAFDANGNEIVEGLTYEWNSNVGEFDADDNDAEVVFTSQEEAPASGEISVSVIDEEENRKSAIFTVEIQPSVLTRIEIQPSEPEPIKSGYNQMFTATGFDEHDNELEGIDFEWRVEPQEIGVLEESGGSAVFTGVKVGWGVVIVSAVNEENEVVPANTSIQVVAGDPARMEFLYEDEGELVAVPESMELRAGDSKEFVARVYDANENIVPGEELSFEWSASSEVGVIEFYDGDASFTAVEVLGEVREGSISVSVVGTELSAGVGISLIPRPASRVIISGPSEASYGVPVWFSAVVYDMFGNEALEEISWSSNGGGFNPSTGRSVLFTPTRIGSVSVTARAGTASQTVSIQVSPGPVASVEIVDVDGGEISEPLVLVAGEARELLAKAVDAGGNEVSEASFEWSVSPELGEFHDNSQQQVVFTASEILSEVREGSISVSVVGTSLSDGLTVQLVPGELSKVEIYFEGELVEEVVEVTAGLSKQFEAKGFDEYGNEVELESVEWSVEGGIGEIGIDGVLSASETVGTGSVSVEGFSEGVSKSDSVEVQVVAGLPVNVNVEASTLNTFPGDSISITAFVSDEFGNAVEGVEVVFALTESPEPAGVLIGSSESGSEVREVSDEFGEARVILETSVGEGDSTVEARIVGKSASVTIETLYTFGNVDGYVFDNLGLPVEEALIVFEETPLQAETNAEGFYRVQGVGIGTYVVSVSREGYSSSSAEVQIVGGKTVQVNFTLIRYGGVDGSVSGISGGIIGASVKVYSNESGELIASLFTDSLGVFTAEELLPGVYDLLASAQNYFDLWVRGVNVVSGEIAQVGVIQLVSTDSTAPSINFIEPTPENASGVSEIITVSVEAIDEGVGVSLIRLLANGGEIASCSSSPCSSALDTGEYADGLLSVIGEASDFAGNSNSISRTFYVDRAAPVIEFVSPTPNNESNVSGVFTIKASATDETPLNASIFVNGLEVASVCEYSEISEGFVASCTSEVDTVVYGDGLLAFYAQASGVLSTSQTGTRIVNVNNTVPRVPTEIIIFPSSAVVSAGEAIDFNASVLDQDGNLMEWASVEWSAVGGQIDENGVFNSTVAGEAIVYATYEDLSANAVVLIIPGVPASLSASASVETVVPGGQSIITAVLSDAYENRINESVINFELIESPEPRGALNASSGVTNESGETSVVLTASSNVSGGVHIVNVSVGELSRLVSVSSTALSLELNADPLNVNPGETSTITARIKNAEGTPVAGVNVSFTLVSAPSGASLSSDSAVTNENGEASVVLTASPAASGGAHVVQASVDGLSASVSVQANATIGALEGFVLSGGQPVAGALIQIIGTSLSATSDELGRYLFGEVAPGVYTVTASAAGYLSQTITNVNVGLGTTILNFNLVELGTVSGVVRDANGNGVEGVLVSVQGGSETAVTGVDGSYSLSLVPGVYNLNFSKQGYAQQYVSNVVISSGETTQVNTIIYALGGVGGRVVNALTDSPISGAVITVFRSGTSEVVAQAVSDANGEYSVDVPAGVYDVQADTTNASENLGVQIVYAQIVESGETIEVVFAFI